MFKKLSKIVLIIFLFVLSCTPVKKIRYDVDAQQEQNEALIDEADTIFELPLEKVPKAWERANLFFSRYLPNERLDIHTPTLLSNRRTTGKYIYVVRKNMLNNGQFSFKVQCFPNRSDASYMFAERNAKNLARFIRYGTLELMALDR